MLVAVKGEGLPGLVPEISWIKKKMCVPACVHSCVHACLHSPEGGKVQKVAKSKDLLELELEAVVRRLIRVHHIVYQWPCSQDYWLLFKRS